MGGTFDPIHIGHLIAAETVREAFHLDEIWFIPASVPPHKDRTPGAAPADRLEMARLAVQDHPQFRIVDLELTRGGISYSIDTVRELQGLHPASCFHYIIGADMVQYLPHWHQIEQLCRMIGFIGLNRSGVELDMEQLPSYIREKVTMTEMPDIQISSTNIRLRRIAGRTIRYLVPDPVYQYIERNQLYGS